MYDQFDEDGNRFLDRAEFAELMRATGTYSEADINATFDYYDHNKDGKVSYEEFQQHVQGGVQTYTNRPNNNVTRSSRVVTQSYSQPTYVHSQPTYTQQATYTHQQPIRTSYATSNVVTRTNAGHTSYNL